MLIVSREGKANSMDNSSKKSAKEILKSSQRIIYPAEVSTQSLGRLRLNVTSESSDRPVSGATVSISNYGDPSQVLEQVTTDANGQTNEIELPTPPIGYSMEPSAEQPYSQFSLLIQAEGFESVQINGTQVLPDVTAVQPINMLPLESSTTATEFTIGAHTLFGNYPPKIAESEVKPTNETGEIVLSKVVVPEYVVVHDGPPRDSSAQNYYVRYRDYISNVASSEIYATWPESTIYANILAIMSFTLNRVYTEWYRNQGYTFTITTSTAYDHKYIPGKNTYENTELLVDNVFANYLSRPNVKQPILTQYCDGRNVQCPNWMTK